MMEARSMVSLEKYKCQVEISGTHLLRVRELETALRQIVSAKANSSHKNRPEYYAGIELGLAECAKIARSALSGEVK